MRRALGDVAADEHPTPDDVAGGPAGTLPLSYPPGERFHYSHATDVLGFLVGRIEGKPFGEVLKDRIFGPLGMTDTDFYVPAGKARPAGHPLSDERPGRPGAAVRSRTSTPTSRPPIAAAAAG